MFFVWQNLCGIFLAGRRRYNVPFAGAVRKPEDADVPPFSLSSPAESGVFFRFPGIVCLLFLQVQGIQCIAKLWKKAKTCSIQSPFCHVFCLFFIVFPSYGIALCRLPFRYVPGNSPLSFHYYGDVPLFCLTSLPPRPWQHK